MGKARAAAMDALQGLLDGARVCDLFAGSGAVGIEALSRGAKSCIFVEQDRAALRALDENLIECERRCLAQKMSPPELDVFRGSAGHFLGDPGTRAGEPAIHRKQYEFELIWADPPYAIAHAVLPEILKFAEQSLSSGGVLMVESGSPLSGSPDGPRDSSREASNGPLQWKAEKKYGGTYITSWKKQ